MKTMELSRRQFLKGTGALIVSFNLFPTASNVEIGTGTVTALAQIVAEELDVSVNRIKMASGDTTKSVEQGATVGSRSIERAGPQFRQAAAAARQELLKLAAARLSATADQLTVKDGVVSVVGNASK